MGESGAIDPSGHVPAAAPPSLPSPPPPPPAPFAPPSLPPPPPPAPAPAAPLGRKRRGWLIGAAIAVVVVAAAAVVVFAIRGDDGAADGAPCPDADGRSGELRRCLSESLVFVATDLGVGSGVLTAGGYVVTNLHVVDPLDAADLTFTDGEHHAQVPVVGIDAFVDLAVLGPVDTDRTPLAIEPRTIDEDDEPDVFLVGFPGGIEGADPSITIAGGLLSRTRTDEAFGLTYLQTDAAISGGQSGGALVDGSGNLLGISGLSFADEFALALSAADVRSSVDRILAGDGDEYLGPTLGAEATAHESTFELTDLAPGVVVVIPPERTRRTVAFDAVADAPIGITVTSFSGSLWSVNDDLVAADADDFYAGATPLDGDGDGHYTFELPGDEYGYVYLNRLDDDTSVTVEADVPFAAETDPIDGGPIVAGDTRGVLQALASTVVHSIELEEGDVVEIRLSAGSSDPYFDLLAPGEEYDVEADPQVDDGGGGLYDLDSFERFEIDQTGTWRIVLSTWDGYTTGYLLSVSIE